MGGGVLAETALLQHVGEREVGAGVVGVELDGAAELCFGFFELPGVEQGRAVAVAERGVVGVELDRQLVLGQPGGGVA